MATTMLRHSPRLSVLNKKLTVPCQEPKRYLPRRSQRIRDQKKKLLKTYVRQLPTVLDNLPMHVISYHIFPFLDYNTRIHLNMCLPSWDRVQNKMSPESIKKHHMNYCVKIVGSMLVSLERKEDGCWDRPWIYSGDKRIQRIIEMLSLFLKDEYFTIYTSSDNFRKTFQAKINSMQALADEYGHLYSKLWLDELLSTCNLLNHKILTYNGVLMDTAPFDIHPLVFT